MKLTLTLDLPSALYSHWAPGGIFMNGAGATVFSGAANRTPSVFSSCAGVSSEQRSAGGSFARATPLTLNAQARVVMTSRGNRIETPFGHRVHRAALATALKASGGDVRMIKNVSRSFRNALRGSIRTICHDLSDVSSTLIAPPAGGAARAWYRASIAEFFRESDETILGRLVEN